MSRSKPCILLSFTDPKTYKSEQVLKANGIYTVFYQNLPINLRTLNTLVSYPGPKYRKTAFSNPGHAFNLCEKLNRIFKTDEFTVVCLTSGTIITEK